MNYDSRLTQDRTGPHYRTTQYKYRHESRIKFGEFFELGSGLHVPASFSLVLSLTRTLITSYYWRVASDFHNVLNAHQFRIN